MDIRRIATDNIQYNIVFSDASDGNFKLDSDPQLLDKNRKNIVDLPWSWVRQVHGSKVVVINEATGFIADADGIATNSFNCPVSVTTADCSPVILIGSNAVAALHAGWRGLEAGIIEQGALALEKLGSTPIATVLGPHISVSKYEFGKNDLDLMANKFGDEIIGETSNGLPALDMYKGVSSACKQVGWPVPQPAACTSDENWFSHRVRKDAARQVAVVWMSAIR